MAPVVLLSSFLVILTTELGDKTFIITAILAMKYSKGSVFLGAMTAATLMITISVMIGLLTTIIPRSFLSIMSILLFLYFGVQMLQEGIHMKDDSEKEEKKRQKVRNELERRSSIDDKDVQSATSNDMYNVFWETLTLNFFAEWGDKSQVSTIFMAAQDGILPVLVGAFAGQLLCNGIAVLGGEAIGSVISTKKVTMIGGMTFIAFSVLSLLHTLSTTFS